jgi:hypothetical protein
MQHQNKRQHSSVLKWLFTILIIALAWYFIVPLFGLTLGMVGGIMSAIIALVFVAAVLCFIWIGLIVFYIVGVLIVAAATVLAIIFAPVLLPLLISALTIVVILRLLFSRKKNG